MRHFSLFILLIFIISSKLNAQNVVIGTVPPGMVNVNANHYLYDYENYDIDFDCDGSLDIFCYFYCDDIGNVEKNECYSSIGIIDTNMFVYTTAGNYPKQFSTGDAAVGNMSYLQGFSLADGNYYLCFGKILPDSSIARYWVHIYSNMTSFWVYDILKEIKNNPPVEIDKYVCSGSIFTFPNGQTITNAQNDTIHVSYLLNNGGCDSTVITHLHVLPPQNSVTQNINLCYGKNYTFPDGFVKNNITANVTHYSNFISNGGCDSFIITNIISLPSPNLSITSDTVHICQGASFTFHDGITINNIQNNIIYHTNMLTNINGCDSIIRTYLYVIQPVYTSETKHICDGGDYIFPDMTALYNIINDTTHVSQLQTVSGCDSTVYTNIIVHRKSYLTDNQNLCYGSNFTLINGQHLLNLVHDTTIDLLFLNFIGCDSMYYHYGLHVAPLVQVEINNNICKHSDFTFADGYTIKNILENSSHNSLLKTKQNCDSFLTTNLIVRVLDTSVTHNLLNLTSATVNQSYKWIDCSTGKIIPDEEKNTFSGEPNKSYKVVIVGNNGCVDTSSCHTVHTFDPTDIGHYVHVFPNPATNIINVELYKVCESVKIKLLNTAGQAVLEKEIANSRLLKVDVSKMPKGVYYLQVNFDDMVENFKVLVE